MALTSSAALGVSELVGRTNKREEAYGEEGERRREEPQVSNPVRPGNAPASLFREVISDTKTVNLSLFAFI